MTDIQGRRPIKSRSFQWAKKFASWLSRRNITPNAISVMSVVFAAMSAACILAWSQTQFSDKWLLLILATLFIQFRLLCNLLDGMVAIEGQKGTPSGELFNDIPDRFADLLILVTAGYAISFNEWGAMLGWVAGVLAVLTAYVRTLAVSLGCPANFQGPMAKQHRMAVMTLACLLSLFEPNLCESGCIFLIALVLIIAGSVLTIFFRIRSAYQFLER